MEALSTEDFAGQVVADMAATVSGVMTNIGHRLGLYRAMAGRGKVTSQELADKTDCYERYVREWLNNQVAGGYIMFDTKSKRYELPDAYIPVLVDTDSPVFLIPALEVAASLWLDEEKISKVFSTGEGIEWGDHHHRLFCGSEALFRPGYKSFLVGDWIASLSGVTEKLEKGGNVADIGCGHGASTVVMANAFPNAKFVGFDLHEESIHIARQRAQEVKTDNNLSFFVAGAKDYVETNFDLICFMDCLHDMGDPLGAAKHAHNALAKNGTLLLVEPAAADCVSNNINPVSRLYYAASTAVCTPCSLSQEVGTALGAQAGYEQLSGILIEAGFKQVKQVAQTGFNIVLEARA